MEYKSTVLRTSAVVRKVISIHYFEYMSNFSFPVRVMIFGNLSVWTRA